MDSVSSQRSTLRKVVDVTSVEHAAAVIRAMRDDQILNGIDDFNDIVVKQAFEVVEKKKIDAMLTIAPSNKVVPSQLPPCKAKSNIKESNPDGDISSDDEDDMSSKQGDGNFKTNIASDIDFPDDCSAESSPARRGITYDSSDDELLGDLGSDDEEDMKELLKGFVGPRISTPNKAGRHGGGGIRDLDDGEGNNSPVPDAHSQPRGKPKQQQGPATSSVSLASQVGTVRPVRSAGADPTLPKGSGSSSIRSMSGTVRESTHTAGAPAKHQIMVTPGQRIRVRPSRKQKSQDHR